MMRRMRRCEAHKTCGPEPVGQRSICCTAQPRKVHRPTCMTLAVFGEPTILSNGVVREVCFVLPINAF